MSGSRWSSRSPSAALIEGRVDAAWARWVRPWTLAAWSFLTVGIALGSFWAYYELGWGGWWFWDPVENASFMPWLIGAALLHSAVVTENAAPCPAGRCSSPRRLHLLHAGRLPGAVRAC
jgi:cytochrome c biogenesis factor